MILRLIGMICLWSKQSSSLSIPVPLSHEWLSETDIAQESRTDVHANQVRQDLQAKASASTKLERHFLRSASHPTSISQTEGGSPQTSADNPVAESEGEKSLCHGSSSDTTANKINPYFLIG